MHERLKLLVAAAVLASSLAIAGSLPPGGTWGVNFDDPNASGEQTTEIELSYIDQQGKKQEVTVTATVRVTPAMTADGKKAALQDELQDELDDPDNQVDGDALASLSGGGQILTITPAGDDQDGEYSDVKIERLTLTDDTGEDDAVIKPTTAEVLAFIEASGDITGYAAAGGADFEVVTELGTVSVALTGGMRKLELLEQVRDGLAAQGAKVWLNAAEQRVYVLLEADTDDGGIATVGAGTTDSGLEAVLTALAP